MEDIQIDGHVAELVQIIGDRASEEDIRKELLRRLSRYRQDIDSTKRAIIYDLCGDDFSYVAGETIITPVSEVPEREGTFTLLCRVLSSKIYTKVGEDGRSSAYTKGSIVDATGIIPFIVWDKAELVIGRTYRFRGCTRNEFRGVISASLMSSDKIKESDSDVRVDIDTYLKNALYTSDIGSTGENVDIRGTIDSLEHTTRKNKAGKVQNVSVGILNDGLTEIRFTDYSDRDFKVLDHILSIGARVISLYGELEIWLGENTFKVR